MKLSVWFALAAWATAFLALSACGLKNESVVGKEQSGVVEDEGIARSALATTNYRKMLQGLKGSFRAPAGSRCPSTEAEALEQCLNDMLVALGNKVAINRVLQITGSLAGSDGSNAFAWSAYAKQSALGDPMNDPFVIQSSKFKGQPAAGGFLGAAGQISGFNPGAVGGAFAVLGTPSGSTVQGFGIAAILYDSASGYKAYGCYYVPGASPVCGPITL